MRIKSSTQGCILLYILISTTLGLNAQSSWESSKKQNKIEVWTRDYPGSNFKEFKAETTIKAELKDVVALLMDVEGMSKWYDRVEKVTLVRKISDMEGIYKIDFDLPWPVANRISAVRAKMSYDKDRNVVEVHTQYENGIVEGAEDIIVTAIQSKWILTPIENGMVHIYHQGYMDPEGSLPAWIANHGVIDGPISTLTKLQSFLEDYKNVQVSFLN